MAANDMPGTQFGKMAPCLSQRSNRGRMDGRETRASWQHGHTWVRFQDFGEGVILTCNCVFIQLSLFFANKMVQVKKKRIFSVFPPSVSMYQQRYEFQIGM